MTFPDHIDGQLLHTTGAPDPLSRSERRHLYRLTDCYALVSSWLVSDPWIGERRLYCVDNRIGNHCSLDEALARFDRWCEA